MNKNSILTPVSPDSGHPFLRDTDGGAHFSGSTELQVRGVSFHSGMTRLERIAGGFMQAGDQEWLDEQNRLHILWRESAEGKEFLKSLHKI